MRPRLLTQPSEDGRALRGAPEAVWGAAGRRPAPGGLGWHSCGRSSGPPGPTAALDEQTQPSVRKAQQLPPHTETRNRKPFY